MNKKYLATSEERKAARLLGIKVIKEMVPMYYIKVASSTPTTSAHASIKAPQINPSDSIILGNPRGVAKPSGITGDVYGVLLFFMKEKPAVKQHITKHCTKQLKIKYTPQQVRSGIAALVRSKYLVKYQPITQEKIKTK